MTSSLWSTCRALEVGAETAYAADARRMLVGVAAVTEIRRRRLGLSHEELSRRCQFGTEYVKAIEDGDASPGVSELAQLAHGLGFECLLDLMVHAALAAARLEAAMDLPVAGGGSNGRSR